MENWLNKCREILMDGGDIIIDKHTTVDQFSFNDKFLDVSNRDENLKSSLNKVIAITVDELLIPYFEQAMQYQNQLAKDEAAIDNYIDSYAA